MEMGSEVKVEGRRSWRSHGRWSQSRDGVRAEMESERR